MRFASSLSRVMLVEDDPATRAGLAQLLWTAGYEVIALSTFDSARSMLRQNPPDLLVTDVRLGTHNGLQLVLSASGIPTIVLTGFDDPVLRTEADRMGATFLVKPISAAVLLSAVSHALETGEETGRTR